MTPQEQREHDIFNKAKEALKDMDSTQLIRALPDGRPGPGFPTGVSLIGYALSSSNNIKGFGDYLKLAQSELKEAGFSEEDIYYWTKGVVRGLQDLLHEKLYPIITEAFKHKTF